MRRTLVVIGASAGGIEPLRRIIAELPADFPATVLVTVHVPPEAPSALPRVLSRKGVLEVAHVAGDVALAPGLVLVAPPDHHLIVERDRWDPLESTCRHASLSIL